MKMRTAMKSMIGICELKSKGCLASQLPQELEVIYVGSDEKTICACPNCITEKLRKGEWAMWYSGQAQEQGSRPEQGDAR